MTKIKVTVSKTVQEQQFEPFHVAFEAEKELKEGDKSLEVAEKMEAGLESLLDKVLYKRLDIDS